MSLTGYIQRVRARPEAEKQAVVFGWTVALTSVVFLVWAVSFSLSVANTQARNEELFAVANQTEPAIEQTQSSVGPVRTATAKLSRLVGETADTIVNGFWITVGLIHR